MGNWNVLELKMMFRVLRSSQAQLDIEITDSKSSF